MLSPGKAAAFGVTGMLAADGRCKALDAAADGYVRAEACVLFALVAGAVVVGGDGGNGGEGSPSAALAFGGDEDGRDSSSSSPPPPPPLALLAGSAVNQDGRSASLTAPSGPAQAAVLSAALEASGALSAPSGSSSAVGARPESISLLEMHGTGTALGDPIEIGAAASVLLPSSASSSSSRNGQQQQQQQQRQQRRRRPLALAAAKARLGHSEPVAGAAGLCGGGALGLCAKFGRCTAVSSRVNVLQPVEGIS